MTSRAYYGLSHVTPTAQACSLKIMESELSPPPFVGSCPGRLRAAESVAMRPGGRGQPEVRARVVGLGREAAGPAACPRSG